MIDEWATEIERLRQNVSKWQGVAARWACCEAGLRAAPDPCPWHGDGVRREPAFDDQEADRGV